jgi:hypothetical protein
MGEKLECDRCGICVTGCVVRQSANPNFAGQGFSAVSTPTVVDWRFVTKPKTQYSAESQVLLCGECSLRLARFLEPQPQEVRRLGAGALCELMKSASATERETVSAFLRAYDPKDSK